MSLDNLLRKAAIELNNGANGDSNIFFSLGARLQRIQGGKALKMHKLYILLEEYWGLSDTEVLGIFFNKETAQIAALERIEKMVEKGDIREESLPYGETIEDVMDDLNSDEGFDSAFAKINGALGYDGHHVLQFEEVKINFS
jgi:hypothetical protein